MSHIIIIGEAIEELNKSIDEQGPTSAKSQLLAALQAADNYAHSENPDEGILEEIETEATMIKYYLETFVPPSDPRLVSYANALNWVLP